jgi:biotin carboxylase
MPGRPAVLFVNTRPTPLEAEPCSRAARRLGLDVVLLADKPVSVPEGAYDRVVAVDTYDYHGLVAAASEVAKESDVRGVVCWGDRDVEGTARVAEALGLPGNSPGAAAAARNKGVFRRRLKEVAPDLSVRYVRLTAGRDVASVDGEVGFPAVVKPAGASSSKGIFTVSTRGELHEAVEELASFTRPEVDPIFRYYPAELVVEEYIEGSEHSVEGLIRGGEVFVAVVTDKWVEPEHCLEVMQTHPSELPEATQSRMREAAQRAVDALGLTYGAFHLELKACSDGSIRLLELNARTGGGYITTHMLPLARGFDFVEATLRVHCGLGDVAEPADAHAFAGSRQLLAQRPGVLERIDGVEAALAVPGMLHFTLERPLGSSVKLPPDGYVEGVLASLVAVGYSGEAVRDRLEAATALLEPHVVEAR